MKQTNYYSLRVRLWLLALLVSLGTAFANPGENQPKADSSAAKENAEAATVQNNSASGEIQFPADELNGGSEVAVEKKDPNPYPENAKQNTMKKVFSWVMLALTVLFLVIVARLSNAVDMMGEISGKHSIDWSKWNPRLFLIFLIAFMGAVLFEFSVESKNLLPVSASEHGHTIDSMFNLTSVFVLIVFFLTQIALFWFTFKYRMRPGNTAYFYPHNDRLEVIWTVIPAIVLAILITGGLKAWNSITAPPKAGTPEIELYAYQFGWTARYPGADQKLGEFNFRKITAENELGINWADKDAQDDMLLKEIHLVVNKEVNFKFRAKDVIHSAYAPYFRFQMNVVPGVPTNFKMKPTITTEKMREILKKEGKPFADNFDYYIICNKICGASHYNMKIKLVVESEEEYQKWMAKQKPSFEPGMLSLNSNGKSN